MIAGRSYKFTRAISRTPSKSVTGGLRDGDGPNPNAAIFGKQHGEYIEALKNAGAGLTLLPALEEFPDSVFVEDTSICLRDAAIVLRPGAETRFGEADEIRPILANMFSTVIDLPGDGFVDGGDVLLSDDRAFIGLSERTNEEGRNALFNCLAGFGYEPVEINTPKDILHFKTECGLLDSGTVFATEKLASLGCFAPMKTLIVPEGEEGAANIVRYNDVVFLSKGYPKSEALLRENGYSVAVLDTSEAAKVDGGLSCMSLRF